MIREEQKQDLRTVEQIIDDMRLFDDDLMSMVFDKNKEAAELLLRIILKQDDIQEESVVGSANLRVRWWAEEISVWISGRKTVQGNTTMWRFSRDRKERTSGEPDSTAV